MPAVLMQDVYNYAYGFTLEKGIKCLPQEVAIEMWRLLLSTQSWPLLESWSASPKYLCLTQSAISEGNTQDKKDSMASMSSWRLPGGHMRSQAVQSCCRGHYQPHAVLTGRLGQCIAACHSNSLQTSQKLHE